MRITEPLLHEEIACWRAGRRRVAGVDEAGRGPLAGPVVAATRLAATRALTALAASGGPPDFVLFDGPGWPSPGVDHRCIVGGDRWCLSVAAASIVAKVERDALMREYHARYPQYGFDRHKGYASAEHLRLLRELGPCPIHRQSYAPVHAALEGRRPAPAPRTRRARSRRGEAHGRR